MGGPPRDQIEREFRQMGLPYRWVHTRAATRVCTTILDRDRATITELVENGRPLSPAELNAFREAYAEEAAMAELGARGTIEFPPVGPPK